MRIFLLGLPLLLGPLPANAAWGPVGVLTRLDVKDSRTARFTGYEAGIMTLTPERGALSHLVYGRAESKRTPATLTWYHCQLSYLTTKPKRLTPYTGAGTGLAWLERGGDKRRLWIHKVHLGLLFAPADILGSFQPSWPCFSCLWKPTDQGCQRCISRKRFGDQFQMLPEREKHPGWLYLGAEAGYRWAKMSLSGFEGKVYVAILL